MIPHLIAFLILFVLQTLLAPTISRLDNRTSLAERFRVAIGPRDGQTPLSPLAGRAHRALVNLQEAMPVFLTLALLHEIHGASGSGAAVPADAQTGALIFLIARALYVPAYLSGVPGVRSLIWTGSWVGLGMMGVALRG